MIRSVATAPGVRDRGDLGYRVYLTFLVLAVLVGPSLHAITVWLATPRLLALVARPDLPALLAALTGLLLWVVLMIGTVRGPVVLSPFRLHLLAGGPLPRRQSLRRPFVTMAVLLVAVAATLGAVPGLSLFHLGSGGWATPLTGALVGALLGALLAVAWLAGQALSVLRLRWTVLTTLLCCGTFALAWWAGVSGPWVGWLALVLAVMVALGVVPRLLEQVRGPVLAEHAWRWQSATTAGGMGDLAAAASAYRAHPRRPRPREAIGVSARLPLLFLRRDLAGAARTPGRSLLALVVLGAGVALAAWVMTTPVGSSWVSVALGFGLAHLALGVWSDGFRHAVEASAAPTLYGVSHQQLLGLHAVLPVVLAIGVSMVAGLAVVLLAAQPLLTGVLAAAGALFCVAVRMFDAAKGPLPLILLTPAPTPVGDMSGVSVALWQADALLIAVIVPTLITTAVLTLGWVWLLAYLPAVMVVLAGLRHRLAAV